MIFMILQCLIYGYLALFLTIIRSANTLIIKTILNTPIPYYYSSVLLLNALLFLIKRHYEYHYHKLTGKH